MSTFLRQLYEVIGCFSTETHIAICNDLLRKLKAKGDGHLADIFADALKTNKTFSQIDCAFVPVGRKNDRGTNPVTMAMRRNDGLINVPRASTATYGFQFIQREIPHLRAKSLGEQEHKGWIDYIARTNERPILGEIKWKGDKNPFYAFIQLLTYLSEMATPNQIDRALKHQLFGKEISKLGAFDLHIFLANFNGRGKKGQLLALTHELARAFKAKLKAVHPKAAECVGR